MTIYAIGDIHGQIEMLHAAHDRVAQDRAAHGTADAPVVHLGDLCDRGPDSKGVIDHLIDGITAGAPWIVLKGNHDRMFQRFTDDPTYHEARLTNGLTWRHPRLGGMTTLASYGVDGNPARAPGDIAADMAFAIPRAHRDFLFTRPLTYKTDDLIFVHAGIRPGVPLNHQAEEDLVWIRQEFITDTTDHGPLVVHGHTVTETPDHAGNRVNLDTGAGYGNPLTVAVFEGRKCWVLTNRGRVPLTPPGYP
ncbi:metallophosphoesterase [Oceaniglobus ichthyenteri]|uniref:metallophosphoesterase n=1 Tax=Oceaniglobus ichthyenteri TaxID=2136177 RepID=UPI000D3470F5|nr:metallophosphoesterase [Oceaniglobus ichthyenteri]